MKQELKKEIFEKFPELFEKDKDGSPFLPWGFEHGDGWFRIIEALCQGLFRPLKDARQALEDAKSFLGRSEYWTEEMVQKAEERVRKEESRLPKILQVKEKFGTLRFYVDHFDEEIAGLIAMGEYLSSVTCEECGAIDGVGRTSGWIKTLCAAHRAQREIAIETSSE